LVRKGDLDLSENYLLENLKINKERIENSFSFLTEEEQVTYIQKVDQSFRSLYAFSNIRKVENPSITGVAYDNILMHKGLLLKSSTGMRFAILNSGDTNLIQKYMDWMKYRRLITKEQSKLLKKQNKALKTWEEKAIEYERELVKASSYFANENVKQPNNWKLIQDQLKKKEVAIEFVRYNAGMFEEKDSMIYAALIVNKTCEFPTMVNLFKENDLAKIYEEVTGSDLVKTRSIYGNKKKRNSALYNLIWAPIEGFVPKGSKVYYSPDGILHRVSFSAIGSENWFLSDNYSIQQMSTTALIGNETEMNLNENTKAAIIGGIKYNSVKVEDEIWSYLPGTKVEIDHIIDLLNRKKMEYQVFSDTMATEKNIKKALSNTEIAHISTHGYFYPDPDELWKNIETTIDSSIVFRGSSRGGTRGFGYYSFLKNKNPMMRSGLALAKANEVWNVEDFPDQEDGVFTAKEVSNLNLQNMKLVVLSACETGLGDIHGAEGVYGLQRAFKMAGAKYIVMSLWQVPDKETQEFMDLFYHNLIERKMNIRFAFEKAQNILKAKYDPYFWAAFVLVE
jgi:CHAT domain-containing protein